MLSANIRTVYINDDPDHTQPYSAACKRNWDQDSLEDSDEENTIIIKAPQLNKKFAAGI